MGARLTDSRQYGHLFATPELANAFDETARLQDWLDILSALAAAQARLGIIPAESAELIAKHADATHLDLDYVAEQTRLTAHSTLGLIRGLQRILPESAREHVYLGATVQDVTDTWFALVMRRVGGIVWRDLRAIEDSLLDLAERHRDTPMVGSHPRSARIADHLRLQGRVLGRRGAPPPGPAGRGAAPVAGRPTRRRGRRPRLLRAGRARGFGSEFCAELGLADPGISWLTARDRIAEFGNVLALVCGTLARIGNEVYELARPEIGELREPTTPDAVSSITMPHKRNPEASEHLDTLARLVRAQSGVLLEGVVAAHERDGRAWKAEWVALPEVCLLTAAALQTARHLLDGLVVDPAAMLANLNRFGDLPLSERMLAGLSRRLGKHRAQQLLHELIAADTRDIGAALVAAGAASADEVREWTDALADLRGGRDDRSRRAPGSRGARHRARGVAVTFRRFPLAVLPTPLVRARGLERALDAAPIWIKRDDLTGFATAGTKARPLEFLIGDACASGAEVVVADRRPVVELLRGRCSGRSRGRAGVRGALRRRSTRPVAAHGATGRRGRGAAVLRPDVAREDLDVAVVEHAARLGERAYVLPRGGATAVGALGCAYAARELADQLRRGGSDGGRRIRIRWHAGRTRRRPGRIRPAAAGDRGIGQPARCPRRARTYWPSRRLAPAC